MPENSLGVIYKEYKKNDVAIDYFNKCLKKNSRNALAHFALGNIEWEKNHLKQAQIHYETSALSDPNYDAPHNSLGNIFAKLNDQQNARKSYEKCLEINPKNKEARVNL